MEADFWPVRGAVMPPDERPSRWPVKMRTTLKLLIGFLIAGILLVLIGVVVGWRQTITHLSRAELSWVIIACLSTMLCLAIWGKTWQIVLEAVGVEVPYRRLVVTFYAATFANYVTPMGQAGGEPFIAYILARDTEANFEQSLASVVTADVLRMAPFFNAGLVGLAYLLFQARLSEQLEEFAVLLIVVAIGLPLGVIAAWMYREPLRYRFLQLIEPLSQRTDRINLTAINDRITNLFESLDLIADSPRALLLAVGFAYIGWVLFALPLYFSGLALNLSVPLLLVCFLVPVAVIAGSTPLPGGLAAIEGTLVVLLTALLAFSADEALAVTTIYRLTSYWLVVILGGFAAFWVLHRA